MKIGFLPIDNRPVCYTLPKLIAEIDESVEFFIPDRKYLGGLTKSADVKTLFEWLNDLPDDIDALILSLDTIAYGGLISSRRCPESFDEIKLRIDWLKEILSAKNCKVYAFSSIMRISDNNYNDEEKEYWSVWGKKIFEYSYYLHKTGERVKTEIPHEILTDYIETRRRNFEINKIYLRWQKEGFFDNLIFSKDDCAEYGMNVVEAKTIEKMGGYVKTGADEIPLTLLARAIGGNIKVCPIFLEPDCTNLISNYEDIPIEACVKSQLELGGCCLSDEQNADILLYVNNFKDKQGEIVMGVDTESFNGNFKVPNKPYMVADVRFTNGSDNGFIKALFENDLSNNKFYGYSGWNTSANTLGGLICGAKFKFLAGKYNEEAFKRLQITRFLDDWGYQANSRQALSKPDVDELKEKMKEYEKVVEKVLNTKIKANYIYPWERRFEVEVELN